MTINPLVAPWGSGKQLTKEMVKRFTEASRIRRVAASQHSPTWTGELDKLGNTIRGLRMSIGEDRHTFAQKIEIDKLDLTAIENGFASLEQLEAIIPKIDAVYGSHLENQWRQMIADEKVEGDSATDELPT